MGEIIDKRRRALLLGATGGLLSLPAWGAEELLTPRQTAGPFYPDLPLLDRDNDLTRIEGRSGIAQGRISELTGRVLDAGGNPLPGVRVEIWQCDQNGRYRHRRDDNPAEMDKHFQGFGQTITDNAGRYRFRTIRPVAYPGRTPHIHAAVFRDGMRPFVTQIYVADEPRNSEDFLFQGIPAELRHLVLADFTPLKSPHAELAASFDFILIQATAQD